VKRCYHHDSITYITVFCVPQPERYLDLGNQ